MKNLYTYTLQEYKENQGSEPFPKWSVLLEPGEYKYWRHGNDVRVNVDYNWETFEYCTHAGIITETLRKNPKWVELWLYTLNNFWKMKAPSVFCIRAEDIL